MATKKTTALTNLTIIPSSVLSEAGRIMTKAEIQELPFFAEMKPKDQEGLLEDVRNLAAAKMMNMMGGLAIGHYLKSIHARCDAYTGAFRRILGGFRFSERTAYRYMETYGNVADKFSNPFILKAAIVRGLPILSYDKKRPLGKYTEAVRMLPPPASVQDEKEANRYLDQLQQTYKERQRKIIEGKVKPRPSETAEEIERDPEFLLKQQYRGVKNALRQIPSRKRQPWLERLVGYLLAEQGISNKLTFAPEAVPEEFNQGPGRPSAPVIEEEVA